MGSLEFISATIGQVISWPMAIVVVVFLLLPELRRLIPKLVRARLGPGGAELDFGEKLEELEQEVEQAQLPPPAEKREGESKPPGEEAEPSYPAAADWRIGLNDLAETDPPGAILVAWRFVEVELAKLAERLDLYPTLRQRSALNVSRKLYGTGALTDGMFGLIDSLRKLRNSVAHAPEPRISADEALEYIEVAQRVVEQLRALLPSSGESEK